MSQLYRADRLVARLEDPRLRVLDARFELTDPPAGRRAYLEGHVPGAVYVDLDRDLASPPGRHGGRHPLPDMERFARTLGGQGIGDEHDIVVYDQGGTMYGARTWWLLRYLGHDRVYVLDGGLPAYLAAGGALSREAAAHAPTTLTLRLRPDMVADRDAVERSIGDPDAVIVDVRARERYLGEVEPLDPVAGHIPSAINLPYLENLEDGRLLAPDALERRFAAARGRETVIAYCGSGVSAAQGVLAMAEVGIRARLYPGSWSDWCSHASSPIATGDAAGDAVADAAGDAAVHAAGDAAGDATGDAAGEEAHAGPGAEASSDGDGTSARADGAAGVPPEADPTT
jgi:thiosulfate/3-mercaptopyruvate sulfurtransferase